MEQRDKRFDQQARQPQDGAAQRPRAESDEDWVADVKRWYQERARGVDVARRQEVLKGLQ